MKQIAVDLLLVFVQPAIPLDVTAGVKEEGYHFGTATGVEMGGDDLQFPNPDLGIGEVDSKEPVIESNFTRELYVGTT